MARSHGIAISPARQYGSRQLQAAAVPCGKKVKAPFLFGQQVEEWKLWLEYNEAVEHWCAQLLLDRKGTVAISLPERKRGHLLGDKREGNRGWTRHNVHLIVAWSEHLQVYRPKGLTLADGVLAPHMLVMSRQISSHLAQREGAAGC
ncbi:hypothetical protein NQZ68_017953 [Dissostichus eleginoides]|nr:hypothetical protein NQZ68_017953 [Dissostichus eleginoides]